MVTIVDVKRSENSTTKEIFFSLIVQGDIEFVQSKETGRMYATSRQCIISSTFSEEVALQMVGKHLPGNVLKVACEEYDYVVPDSGEIIRLKHRYEYVPEGATATQSNRTDQTNSPSRLQADVHTFSTNGTQQLVEA